MSSVSASQKQLQPPDPLTTAPRQDMCTSVSVCVDERGHSEWSLSASEAAKEKQTRWTQVHAHTQAHTKVVVGITRERASVAAVVVQHSNKPGRGSEALGPVREDTRRKWFSVSFLHKPHKPYNTGNRCSTQCHTTEAAANVLRAALVKLHPKPRQLCGWAGRTHKAPLGCVSKVLEALDPLRTRSLL